MSKNAIEYYLSIQKKITIERYKQLNEIVLQEQILFCGSSLCEQFPILEILQSLDKDTIIYNRGVGGFTLSEFINNIETLVFELHPRKIFMNIGTNDISTPSFSIETHIETYTKIISMILKQLPNVEIYILSYYPVNPLKESFIKGMDKEVIFKNRNNKYISQINLELQALCLQKNLVYIDLFDVLIDQSGNLKSGYTVEGVHLWPQAYFLIFEKLKKYF